MRRGLLLLFTLAAALPAAAQQRHRRPRPPAPPPLLQPVPWSPEASIRDGSATCGACRTTTARFIVINELHYGFNLRPEGDMDKLVWVIFADVGVRARFDQMFAQANLPSLFGRRVYCDCTGIRYDMADTTILRITDARLFAR